VLIAQTLVFDYPFIVGLAGWSWIPAAQPAMCAGRGEIVLA
jgi:hypothetical protein